MNAAVRRGAPGAVVLLYMLSGAAALTYEVLWQRELGLLFGNTTQATSTTLAVFFTGLAVGSWFFGKRAARLRHPLRTFGVLELCAAASALLLPALLPLYHALFPALYAQLGSTPALFLGVKVLLSAVVLVPPAILLGGTWPVLTEAATRRGDGLARSGILLYAANTAGAMLGAALAGFVLPRLLGYRGAYAAAVGTSAVVGLVALALARGRSDPAPAAEPSPEPAQGRRFVLALAALSGFTALGLEVLWTRMVALAIVNSVYAFTAVLVAFLAALALGATLARVLARRVADPAPALQVLLGLAALATLFSGTMFRVVTGSPPAIGRAADFGAYVFSVAGVLALSIVPAALAVGLVFPFLLKVEEARGAGPAGARVGRLAAANTTGALLGALAAGFLLPAALGLWASISLLAGLYGVALLFAPGASPAGRLSGAAAGALVLAMAGLHALGDAPAGERWDLRKDETVIARYEGSAGSVRVVKRRGHLKLRLNNSYTLGGTAEPRWEHYQAHIPLCLHGEPKRVFFLGMGTGITAGAALRHDVEQVRVAEIVPEAVQAAREHFGPWVGGLFEDPRAEVVAEDARTILRGLDDTYDVIIGDLFLPWRRGTALLYTQEHFAAVRARLAPGGLFAQWLPLYQFSEEAFHGVVASFLAVFGEATLWRGDFFGSRPIVALVGRVGNEPWDHERTIARWSALERDGAVDIGPGAATLPYTLYAGRIVAPVPGSRRLTDADPWIEHAAPIQQRAWAAGVARPFIGQPLAAYEWRLLTETAPDEDPFLTRLDKVQRRYVLGGMHLYDYAVYRGREETERRTEALWGYFWAVPEELQIRRGEWVD